MSEVQVKIMDHDKANLNGRTYTTEAMEKAIADTTFPIMGTLGMPEGLTISLYRVSHAVEGIEIRDGAAYAKIKVLATPAGKALDQLLTAGLVEFRVAGTGNIDKDGTVSDFKLLTVSAVDAEKAA
jgi:hypothetical protein